MNPQPDETPAPINAKFVFGRHGYEMGIDDYVGLLDSDESLQEYAIRQSAELSKPDETD